MGRTALWSGVYMFHLRLGSVRSLTSRLCHQQQQARVSCANDFLGAQQRAQRASFDILGISRRSFVHHSSVTRKSICVSASADATSDNMAEELKSNKMFGGFNKRFKHQSKACG